MKVGDLFSGMGGFAIASEAMGWSTAWFVEIDPFCRAVLAKHFPDRPIYGDITAVDWTTVEPVDVLTGGFPCQPHSVAGKREASDDDRDLWSECVRAVGVLRPRYAVFENVPGLLTSESGRFLNRVIRDLAALGYVGSYDVLSAAQLGAPHKRERLWIVAQRLADSERVRCERRGATRLGRCRLADDQRSVGDPTRGGRGTGSGEPVRRTERGREPVGNAQGERCEGLGASGQQEPRSHAGSRLPLRRGSLLRDWSDATPVRGADGTVRLVPRQAVEEAGARIEPSLRTLAHGISDGLVGRDHGGEAEAWPTPTVGDSANTRNATAVRHRIPPTGIHAGETMLDAIEPWSGEARGGSLWPVTENEKGRVAKLRAIGNSVVPLWVVEGPFAEVLRLEAARAAAVAA